MQGTQDKAIAGIIGAAFTLASKMGSLQQVGDRHVTDSTDRSIQLEDSEFEPLLIGPIHYRSPRPGNFGLHYKWRVTIVAWRLRRGVLEEGHQEELGVIVPAFDPALMDTAAGRSRTWCDYKHRQAQSARLGGINLRSVTSGRPTRSGVVVEHSVG